MAAEAAAATAEAERAAAAEAEAAAQRLQMEDELESLNLMMHSAALRRQEVQAQLGVVPPAPQDEDEALCVVCMDAPKRCVVLPCMHMWVCEACTQRLVEQGAQSCPVCRGPIERIERVFT